MSNFSRLIGPALTDLPSGTLSNIGDYPTSSGNGDVSVRNVFADMAYQNLIVFTDPTTIWTVPDVLRNGLVKAHVTVIGGGGGGGSAGNSNYRGGGGGGGGYSEDIISLAGINSIEVTVGIGGSTAGSGSGGMGGTSSFGTYISATGGNGGIGGVDLPGYAGGFSGMGIGGAINTGLGDGSDGSTLAAHIGGQGGGAGGRGSSGSEGQTGKGYGGGGGGSSMGYGGGNGAAGIIIVRF